MEELIINTRRGKVIITKKDIIMDNGACFQLMTQKYTNQFSSFCYELSKVTCKRLIKKNILILNNRDNVKELNYYKLV